MSMIIRWTIGECSSLGVLLLRESIRHASMLFPEAERYVVVNSGHMVDVDAQVVQAFEEDGIPKAFLTAWKYAPTRLSIDQHELSLDNDIVFLSRPRAIDEWLDSDHFLTYESLHRNHGAFAPLPWKINSGIMGCPPGFDLHAAVVQSCRRRNVEEWTSHFDDQGCWASIVGELPRIEIGQAEIPCVEVDEPYRRGFVGVHFVGANRDPQHIAAKQFIGRKKKRF